jgi:hypothetical protein
MHSNQVCGRSKRLQSEIDVVVVVSAPDRSVYELYAKGRTYEEIHEQNRASRHLWEKYIPNTSFKFVVNGYNHSISKARQRQVIEDFSYMGFLGTIDLLNPEVTLGCFEECELKNPLEGFQHGALELMVSDCHQCLSYRSQQGSQPRS